MELKWTNKALSDLVRLYEFLSLLNKPATASTLQSLAAAPAKLLAQPRIGEKLEEFDPREVRRILVGRYEIQQSTYCGSGIRGKSASNFLRLVAFILKTPVD